MVLGCFLILVLPNLVSESTLSGVGFKSVIGTYEQNNMLWSGIELVQCRSTVLPTFINKTDMPAGFPADFLLVVHFEKIG